MKIKCPRCDYEWEYKGKMYYCQRPRCRKSIKVLEVKEHD